MRHKARRLAVYPILRDRRPLVCLAFARNAKPVYLRIILLTRHNRSILGQSVATNESGKTCFERWFATLREHHYVGAENHEASSPRMRYFMKAVVENLLFTGLVIAFFGLPSGGLLAVEQNKGALQNAVQRFDTGDFGRSGMTEAAPRRLENCGWPTDFELNCCTRCRPPDKDRGSVWQWGRRDV